MSDRPLLPTSEAICVAITVVLVAPKIEDLDFGTIRLALEETFQKYLPDARYGYPPVAIEVITLPEIRDAP